MKLEEAREARKVILDRMYRKGPLPKTSVVSKQLLGYLDGFHNTSPWNKPSVGYSFVDYANVGVRLEVRIAQSARKARDLKARLESEYGDEVHVANVSRPQIFCGVAEDPSAQARRRRYEGTAEDPLPLGVSVGTDEGTTGTLGFFAVDGKDSLGFVSCYHVLGSLPYWEEPEDGQRIYQPGPQDETPSNRTHIARLGHYNVLHHKRPNRAESAFAILKEGVHVLGNRIPALFGEAFADRLVSGPLGSTEADLLKLHEVYKVGRTSGLTKGYVSALAIDSFSVDIEKDSSMLHYLFDNVIEIMWDPSSPEFSVNGDSGGLIFSNLEDELKAVGMVFAGGKIFDVDGVRGTTYGFMVKDILAAHEADWYDR